MVFEFWQTLGEMSPVAEVIISISIMLFAGFAMTRLTKRLRLPNVTAYILAGILIGPYGLNMIPEDMIEGMDFLSDIALAFIAFGVGEFFRLEALRKNGIRVVLITVLESCMASVAVFALMYGVLHINLPFSVVLAALASATAPASTVMTIRQTGAHGDFVDTLLQVVALDDVVGLVLYSVAISIAMSAGMGDGVGSVVQTILRPILVNAGVLLLGGVFGVLLRLLFRKRSTDNRLIVSIAMIFAFCGVCVVLDVSPLLGCMSMGMVYINLTGDDKLFKQLNYWSPPILLLFFVRSGLGFRLDSLTQAASGSSGAPLLAAGVGYFIARIVGKYLGAFAGCQLAGKNARVRNYLGLALIPQAGVAIGLAALGARTLGGSMGEDLQTIILASSVLYELVGPGCAKLSLFLSGSYGEETQSAPSAVPDTPVSSLDALIERLHAIERQLPRHEPVSSAEEDAYNEAAEAYEIASYHHSKRFKGKIAGGM